MNEFSSWPFFHWLSISFCLVKMNLTKCNALAAHLPSFALLSRKIIKSIFLFFFFQYKLFFIPGQGGYISQVCKFSDYKISYNPDEKMGKHVSNKRLVFRLYLKKKSYISISQSFQLKKAGKIFRHFTKKRYIQIAEVYQKCLGISSH